MIIIFDNFDNITNDEYKEKYLCIPKNRQDLINKKYYEIDKKIAIIEYNIIQNFFSLANCEDFLYNEFGKPHLLGKDNFSISHTDNVLCIKFCKNNVGVDIEKIRDFDNSLAKSILNFEEYKLLQNCSAKDKNQIFFDLYTKKESFIKCKGLNLSRDLKNILDDAKNCTFTKIKYKNYIINICTQN